MFTSRNHIKLQMKYKKRKYSKESIGKKIL